MESIEKDSLYKQFFYIPATISGDQGYLFSIIKIYKIQETTGKYYVCLRQWGWIMRIVLYGQ